MAMKRYKMSFASQVKHVPQHPERTGVSFCGGLDFDAYYQEWPNEAALRKTIEMQSKTVPHSSHWRAWVTTHAGRRWAEGRTK
jgi:hypothetical protein